MPARNLNSRDVERPVMQFAPDLSGGDGNSQLLAPGEELRRSRCAATRQACQTILSEAGASMRHPSTTPGNT